MKDFHLLIAGELVSGASVFEVVNSATGQPFAFCPAANATLLDQAVAAAKKRSLRGQKRTLTNARST
jgi:acyl-CoA reductase-like NAD-dependent aldehyde dehydrogenase